MSDNLAGVDYELALDLNGIDYDACVYVEVEEESIFDDEIDYEAIWDNE